MQKLNVRKRKCSGLTLFCFRKALVFYATEFFQINDTKNVPTELFY